MTDRLVIRNGTVVDGTGAPAHRADVAIADGRVTAIGNVDDLPTRDDFIARCGEVDHVAA